MPHLESVHLIAFRVHTASRFLMFVRRACDIREKNKLPLPKIAGAVVVHSILKLILK